MNLMILATRLESAKVGKRGKDIYINMMPIEAEQAIMLRLPFSGTKINHELPGYFHTTFQVIVRSHSYKEGEELSKKVVSALTVESDERVDDHVFKHCRAQTDPIPFPLSKGNLIEFNVTFDTAFVRGVQ